MVLPFRGCGWLAGTVWGSNDAPATHSSAWPLLGGRSISAASPSLSAPQAGWWTPTASDNTHHLRSLLVVRLSHTDPHLFSSRLTPLPGKIFWPIWKPAIPQGSMYCCHFSSLSEQSSLNPALVSFPSQCRGSFTINYDDNVIWFAFASYILHISHG